MLSNPTASGDSNGDLFAFLTNSSFTLPFLVVLLVAILLVLCRQKRHPTHYRYNVIMTIVHVYFSQTRYIVVTLIARVLVKYEHVA